MSELKQLFEPVIAEKDHLVGLIKSPIVILEYGDYQCRDGFEAYWVMKKLQKKFKENICFVFRNFPLVDFHPNAFMAAIAAEAAAAQNKFWQMYDILFLNQNKLNDEDILKYAKKIGLNMELFERDYFNKVYFGKIQKDIESGISSGVEEVPTIFINGIMYDGVVDFRTLDGVIKSVMRDR